MAYNHGVKVSEKPTSILPPVSVSAGIPFIVGTAPVNMSDVSNVNRPVLCSSYAEAVAAFGFVPPVAIDASGLKKYEYSISQFIYSHFALFGASPVIIVNALDPTTHKKAALVSAVTLDADGSAVIPESGIIKSSVSLGSGGGGEATKAHGAYPVLRATAATAGASGNDIKLLIYKEPTYDICVDVYTGSTRIGTAKADYGSPDTIPGFYLDGMILDDYNESSVEDYATFLGTIAASDIPNQDNAIVIRLSGGDASTKAVGIYESPNPSLTVEAANSGSAGNSLMVEIYDGGSNIVVNIYNGVDEVFSSHFVAERGEYGTDISADTLNELTDDGLHEGVAITDFVSFTGDITISSEYTSESPVVIQLSGGEDAGSGSGSAYVEGTDYEAAFDDDGYLVITSLKNIDGTYKIPTGEAIAFSAQKLNPAAVDVGDVIGGVDVSGNKSGFELVDECFPRFRLVPGLLLAPGYSGNAGLAAVMAAKAANINQEFTAIALIDVPTESVGKYSDVAAWKNTNSITDPRQIVCWPGVALDGVYYDLSVQLAGAIAITDSENDDVPYVSPSNHAINATASVLASGEEVWIAPDTGAYLNGQGVVTALNFIGGWVAWGNRTACYPANTDVKDSFIPVKRMFAWVGNTIIQTYWSKVDAPLNRRLIDTIIDSVNLWLNGLAARQYIIGGRVEFNPDENPSPDLLDGIARFHVYITPASPARELDFLLEYSPEYLNNLFA